MRAILPLAYGVGRSEEDADMGAAEHGCEADLLLLWTASGQPTRMVSATAAEHQDLALSASESLRQRSP